MADEPDVERFTFCLRVSHPNLKADDIEARVGQVAKRKINAGDVRTRKDGSPLQNARPAKNTLCVFQDIDGPADLFSKSLVDAARRIEARGEPFSSLIAEGCEAEFFVGYFLGKTNNGFTIEPEISALIARLSISLTICLYNHID